jgi:Glycosyl transferases group 1
MKLVVAPLRVLDRYVSREFSAIIRELVDLYHWTHVEFWTLRQAGKSLSDAILGLFDELPEAILFWEGYDFINAFARQIRALDCRKAMFADDLHEKSIVSRWSRLASYLTCDIVFPTYVDRFEEMFPEASRLVRVVWVPHSASPEFLIARNENAENAILLSGAVNEYYPLRQAMKALCDFGLYPIVYHPHPGYQSVYRHGDDPRVSFGYARLLNRYRAAFTDSSRFGYLVAKFFEIPATGALLLADRRAESSLRRLGFVAGDHYISTSFDDLEAQVRFILDESNQPALDQIRRNAQILVWEHHKTSDRCRVIDGTCVS